MSETTSLSDKQKKLSNMTSRLLTLKLKQHKSVPDKKEEIIVEPPGM